MCSDKDAKTNDYEYVDDEEIDTKLNQIEVREQEKLT